MLTCIACSKQLTGGSLQQQKQDEDDAIATPRTKHTIKILTTQIKDMVLRASGAYKSCRPCSGCSENVNHGESDLGSASKRFNCAYRRTADSNSTPKILGKEIEARLKGLSSGEGTPVSVSSRTESIVYMEEDEPKEWVAQAEPGVLITFVSMPQGGNDLKRIRFSRELFNKSQAQRWWAESYDKVMELYNVQRFNEQSVPLQTPPRSEDEGLASKPKFSNISRANIETSSMDASARSSSSREADCSGELSVSNASDMETEWIEQDEPGVYITIRALPGGTRELRRVRFSRERFGEMHARLWWEENKARIQEQYL
ncbi:hypothetical protein Nepgr_017873 [Nepenthes gracilis]|uniref:BRX domain-containing protein n=1 Tax=Nepenthes gracilis TaxID=150966 RepID=A0AAD3XSJ5_NEPGR|nr:hypothetical protein Nepgr_017873 [Nepenthes gracilis]